MMHDENIPRELTEQFINVIDQEVERAHVRICNRNTFCFQVACLIVCPLSVWGFIELHALPYNLLPINIGPINVVDSILLEILGSLSLTAFGAFFYLFKAYK